MGQLCRTRVVAAVVLAVTLMPLCMTSAMAKVYRVGFLNSGGAGGDGIARALAGRGYRIGDDLLVENRSAEGDPGRLPGALKQLLDLRVDVVVTFSYPAAFAAKQGAGGVPIVAIGSGDLVASGLVASLARPGGNITGISDVAAELAPKRLELLKIAAPAYKRWRCCGTPTISA
jgi:putative tryptophan/tyrosine transport system substrate-binding protein